MKSNSGRKESVQIIAQNDSLYVESTPTPPPDPPISPANNHHHPLEMIVTPGTTQSQSELPQEQRPLHQTSKLPGTILAQHLDPLLLSRHLQCRHVMSCKMSPCHGKCHHVKENVTMSWKMSLCHGNVIVTNYQVTQSKLIVFGIRITFIDCKLTR